MQQDKLRDFLKFFRFHLAWLVLSAGFFAVIILTGVFFSARLELKQVSESDQQIAANITPTPAPIIDPEAYNAPENPTALSTLLELQSPEPEVSAPSDATSSDVTSSSLQPESPAFQPTAPAPISTPSATTQPLNFKQPKNLNQTESQERAPSNREATTYVVQKGDTLWAIAERYLSTGTNFSRISQENNLKNPNLILVGQTLKIPELVAQTTPSNQVKSRGSIGSGVSIDRELTGPTKSYTVVNGDSLWKIALRELGDPYLWPDLYQLNRAVIGENADLIYPGTTLLLPTFNNAPTLPVLLQ